MAHFAKIDADNNVLEVVVVDNNDITDDNGNEVEQLGINLLSKVTDYSVWRQTSYNGSFRKNYAGIGYKYREDLDGFYDPTSPFDSWLLNPDTLRWEAPTPMPEETENSFWNWSELIQEWVEQSLTTDGE